MTNKIERRVALISGASRGIGDHVAAELFRQGWAVSLGMRNPAMPAWAGSGDAADFVHLAEYDANDTGAEARWVEDAMQCFGRVDAIIANAGIMIPKTVIEAEDEDIDAMLAVNVKAPRRLAKAAWEPLCESGQGRVIILASLSGKRVKSAGSGSYAVSKFAAVALSHAIRQAGFEKGVRATAVCPGFVATDMAAGLTARLAELPTQPADLARIIALLVSLPNEASVAEFAINCQLEESFEMPGPYVVPVHGDDELPKEVDVVVIGGGIIGTSTALELVDSGLRVALCEKGGIGHEQSSRNWGWVRISRRDPREVPLMAESLRIWADLNRRTGRETGFKRSGIVFTCADEKQFEEHASWNRNLEGYQIESRMLSAAEFKAKYPDSNMNIAGALYTAGDCRAEPQRAAPAIAEAARDRGAHILTECAVRGLQLSAGRVSGVVTERGEIACKAVVLAGGAWSSLFLGNSGLDLPQLKVMNSVLRTKPLEGGPEEALWSNGFAIRKRLDGGYTIADGFQNIVDIVPASFRYATKFLPALGHEWRSLRFRFGGRFYDEFRMPRHWALDEPSFEYNRVLDPIPSKAMTDSALAKLAKAFPVFEKAEIAQRWAGMIDVTPDAIPVIDAIDAIPGFHVATGFSGHGFGIGPAAGRLMADIVTGRPPLVERENFRFKRFSDGSKIELISGF